jgi:hypothetical protein
MTETFNTLSYQNVNIDEKEKKGLPIIPSSALISFFKGSGPLKVSGLISSSSRQITKLSWKIPLKKSSLSVPNRQCQTSHPSSMPSLARLSSGLRTP